MGKESTQLDRDISALKNPIEHWRAQRTKQGPMPPELWEAAVRLARIHGTQPVAKALNLNYGKLKALTTGGYVTCPPMGGPTQTKMAPIRPRSQPGLHCSGFVELEPTSVGDTLGKNLDVAIELSRADGCQLKIQCHGGAVLDIKTLVETFLESP